MPVKRLSSCPVWCYKRQEKRPADKTKQIKTLIQCFPTRSSGPQMVPTLLSPTSLPDCPYFCSSNSITRSWEGAKTCTVSVSPRTGLRNTALHCINLTVGQPQASICTSRGHQYDPHYHINWKHMIQDAKVLLQEMYIFHCANSHPEQLFTANPFMNSLRNELIVKTMPRFLQVLI